MTQPTLTREERIEQVVNELANKDDYAVFATSLLTPEERAILRRYYDYIDWLGKDDEASVSGKLTTRDLMFIGWYRQQSEAEQNALIAALRFSAHINALWKSKAGAE